MKKQVILIFFMVSIGCGSPLKAAESERKPLGQSGATAQEMLTKLRSGRPSWQDISEMKRFLNLKKNYRCIKSGIGCSPAERKVLGALDTFIATAIAAGTFFTGRVGYKKFTQPSGPIAAVPEEPTGVAAGQETTVAVVPEEPAGQETPIAVVPEEPAGQKTPIAPVPPGKKGTSKVSSVRAGSAQKIGYYDLKNENHRSFYDKYSVDLFAVKCKAGVVSGGPTFQEVQERYFCTGDLEVHKTSSWKDVVLKNYLGNLRWLSFIEATVFSPFISPEEKQKHLDYFYKVPGIRELDNITLKGSNRSYWNNIIDDYNALIVPQIKEGVLLKYAPVR